MRSLPLALTALLYLAPPLHAQTADDIIARYIARVGGMERIQATTSMRRRGRYNAGGGFEATVVEEKMRPNLVRQEFTLQGMSAINAYDGALGWKINPFAGKKDAEALGEEELHDILLESDIEGPLINYKTKGVTVQLVGSDQVEGTPVYKLRAALPNGDVRHYYMDKDSFVPIRMEETRLIRGSEHMFETTLGDYKPVGGWLLPFSVETAPKGQPHSTITYETAESNITLDRARFTKPPLPASPASPEND